MNSFDRAQAQYDNMLPDDGPDPIECEDCNGTGNTGLSDCCEVEVTKEEYHHINPITKQPVTIIHYICTKCGETCDLQDCTECKGEGEVIPEPTVNEPDDDGHCRSDE